MPFPSLSCLINPLWPSPSFTAFHKTRMKWERKTSPVLKALNNLLSQFGNNLNQFDVLSNKICCCLPISAAPWMTVNLHFLIKLAGIFIRGLGYANGNVVYSRLTEFWNKFNRDTFAGKKSESLSLTSFIPISPGGSLYSKEPCQGRVLHSNEVISIALSTEEKHSHSQPLFLKYRFQMIPKYRIFIFAYAMEYILTKFIVFCLS